MAFQALPVEDPTPEKPENVLSHEGNENFWVKTPFFDESARAWKVELVTPSGHVTEVPIADALPRFRKASFDSRFARLCRFAIAERACFGGT